MSHSMFPLVYKMLGHFAIFSTITGGLIAVDYRDQVTLGSVIIGALVIVIAGVLTIRSNIAKIWREDAEGQRLAKEIVQEELRQEKLSYIQFEKSQQEIRHDLKDKIAELSAQLRVMEAKTDLTGALDAIKEIAIAQQAGHHETHLLLTEIRDKLPSEPLTLKEPIIVKDVGKE